jgi:hypothetical protein
MTTPGPTYFESSETPAEASSTPNQRYNTTVTLPEIQRAIETLSEDEQAQLATWVADRHSVIWDAEIERDFAAGGAGSALLENVRQQVRSGKSRPFTEGPRRA